MNMQIILLIVRSIVFDIERDACLFYDFRLHDITHLQRHLRRTCPNALARLRLSRLLGADSAVLARVGRYVSGSLRIHG